MDEPDKGSAECAGLDEGLAVGTDDGAGNAEGLADKLVEKKRSVANKRGEAVETKNRHDEIWRGGAQIGRRRRRVRWIKYIK